MTELFQQYTLLVFITLEVAASMKLPGKRALRNPTSLSAPSQYATAWWGSVPTDQPGEPPQLEAKQTHAYHKQQQVQDTRWQVAGSAR